MFPVIHIGPLAIQSRGLILLLSFWLAAEAAERGAKRLGLPGSDRVYSLGFVGGLFGLIGARLGYVIEHWTIFQHYPAQVIALDLNTLSPAWGVSIGVVAAYLYARRKGIASRTLLDALTPGLAVFAFGLALADLASGDGYGAPTSLPWAIELWGAPRQPTQIYQLMAVVVIGLILWRRSRPFNGVRFGLFVSLYAASRLFIEAFHGDSVVVNGVRLVQVWSLIAMITALWILRRWATRTANASTAET
jgi:phosphatidylglycerol:prolipoprotein diacylglycerol transferase